MMIKRSAVFLFLLLLTIGGQAQSAPDALEKFMTTYSQNFNRSLGGPIVRGKIGDKMPAYDFGHGLNSKSLRGKTVVLTYWATWCGGCRLLCQDLDSVMFRHAAPGEYADVQVIGVDAAERMVNKGYKASQFWKEKGIHFPTTAPGKAADDNAKAVDAGHPSTIIVDGDGIIRGRWEAWSPGVAGDVALAAWILSDMPRKDIKTDISTASQLLRDGHADRALYLLEQLPADTLRDHLRLLAILDYSPRLALQAYDDFVAYYRKVQNIGDGFEWEHNSREYVATMRDFRDRVLNMPSAGAELTDKAYRAARSVMTANKYRDVKDIMVAARLRWKYGEAIHNSAAQLMRQALRQADEAKSQEAAAIRQWMKEHHVTETDSEMTPSHRQILNDEHEQEEHMKMVKK